MPVAVHAICRINMCFQSQVFSDGAFTGEVTGFTWIFLGLCFNPHIHLSDQEVGVGQDFLCFANWIVNLSDL